MQEICACNSVDGLKKLLHITRYQQLQAGVFIPLDTLCINATPPMLNPSVDAPDSFYSQFFLVGALNRQPYPVHTPVNNGQRTTAIEAR